MGHVSAFEALTDSLEVAKSAGTGTYKRVLQLLTAELGAIRTILTSEQHVAFDPKARVWLREQARQGYAVAVPGVTPAP